MALDLATIEGAKALGLDGKTGRIEIGKAADLILVDTRSPNLTPIHGRDTVISDLVYSASPGNVDTTVVNGRVLMEKRHFTTLDQEAVTENANRLTQDLLERSTRS